MLKRLPLFIIPFMLFGCSNKSLVPETFGKTLSKSESRTADGVYSKSEYKNENKVMEMYIASGLLLALAIVAPETLSH